MIDLAIRVRNPVVWALKARELGLKEEVVVVPEVLDENGDIVTPAETEWVFKDGVYVDEIDTIWVTQPTYDENGDVVSSGTKAAGAHYNVRITDPDLIAYWQDLWENEIPNGVAAGSNSSETAWKWQGVEFVDISTVATPQRVWL